MHLAWAVMNNRFSVLSTLPGARNNAWVKQPHHMIYYALVAFWYDNSIFLVVLGFNEAMQKQKGLLMYIVYVI